LAYPDDGPDDDDAHDENQEIAVDFYRYRHSSASSF